jgi:spectinomycin phosphotransferase
MLERPNIRDEKIISCLETAYGLTVSGIEFLPLGYDSTAGVYRVEADGRTPYFLKVKKGMVNAPALYVPHYLRDHGLEQVVAPAPATDGELWKSVDGFNLILYPFVEGEPGMDVGLSDSQWVEYGQILRHIHSTGLPPEILANMKLETFHPKWSGVVQEIQALVESRKFDDPYEKELAAFWTERINEIGSLLKRAEELGKMLRAKPQEFVLCHADIHTANVLLTPDQQMFVVDWDETLLAPKERDLMFVVGGSVGGEIVDQKREALFFEGYGKTEIHPLALAYYRYEWCVQDIGEFGHLVILAEDIGEETKQDAVRGLQEMFAPGNVVAAAYQSEQSL